MPAEKSATLTPDAPEDVLQSLLEVVQERGLKVGDQLPSIRELAERLEVKATTVRDALLRAQTMGLVRILPRAGAFLRALPAVTPSLESLTTLLTPPTPRDVPNLFHLLDARRLIEVEMAGRAAERRRLEDLLPVRRALEAMATMPADTRDRGDYVEHDIRFHIEIARVGGNLVLFQFQQALLEQLRTQLIALPWTPERQHRTDHSHAAIYAALVAGDAPRARSEMSDHLSMAYNSLLHDVQTAPLIGNRPERHP